MDRAGADDDTIEPLPASDGVAAGGGHPVWPRLMSAVRPHYAALSLFFVAIGAVADFMTVVAPVVHWFLLASLTAVLLSLIAGRLRRPWRALCRRVLLYAGMLFLVCLGFFTAQHPSNFWQRLLSIPQAVAGERGALAAHVDQVAVLQELLGLVRGIDDKIDQIDATTQRTEAKLDQILVALSARAPDMVAAAERAGIPRSTIIELARRIAPTINDTDAALRELDYAVAIAIRVANEARHGTNLGGFIETVLARVAELSRNGRFDEAGTAAGDAFLAWQREEATRQAEEEERRERSRTAGIRLLRAAYDQDVLARKPVAAAGRLVQIIDLEHSDADARYTALLTEQNALYEEGRDRGIAMPLEIAIELARVGLERARDADERGGFANNSGNILATLGERESGTARLSEAVEAYKSALIEWPRERVPLGWATAKNNLGTALASLGERESDTVRLKEAVQAFRSALLERTREAVPLNWGTTQNNLGSVLATLGKREGDMARLEEAIEAFRSSLLERSRERVPMAWAMTQNNIGIALQVLGEHKDDATHLEEAVEAYRSALLEQTRERSPLNWALIQNNLGTALIALGERESGTERLEEAIEAFKSALLEQTRERAPLDWAMTQNNLGTALQALGERESGTKRLEEAIEAYRSALLERTRPGLPLQWAATQNNLGNALATLGEREGGAARLEEAVDAYRSALLERIRERVPFDWALTMENLALAKQSLGDLTGSRAFYIEALAAVEGALEVYTETGADSHIEKATTLRSAILAALAR